MKIDNAAAQQAYASAAYRNAIDPSRGVAQGAQGTAGADATKLQTNDRVNISAQGRLRAQALDAVRSAPATRAKLVMELRSQIKTGTYTVDEAALARHLAQRADVAS
jgi:flagellar biosynthesis anti-sigma factor FlgM